MINMYNTDCMKFMADKPDNYYELAIVDPPYGIGVKGENPIKNKNDENAHNYKKEVDWDDCIPSEDYFNELMRCSNNQIIWGGNHYLDILGFCKAPIIWDKLNGNSPYADGEFAWTSKDLPKNLKIWRHQWCGAFKDSERKTTKIHPTQKPVSLYKWLLNNYAKKGDKILDTHGGSGSICIACHDLGFDLDWMELDKDYYDAAVKRFNIHKSQGQFNFEDTNIPNDTDSAGHSSEHSLFE